jgi:hypothetical protein
MNRSAIDKFVRKIREEKAEVEVKYAPQIRNHLKQLFDKAKVKDIKLEGIRAFNGAVFLDGKYKTDWGTYEKIDNFDLKTLHRDSWPEFIETRDLFNALHEYEENLHELPYIEPIK